jgi:hypothetical protein
VDGVMGNLEEPFKGELLPPLAATRFFYPEG